MTSAVTCRAVPVPWALGTWLANTVRLLAVAATLLWTTALAQDPSDPAKIAPLEHQFREEWVGKIVPSHLIDLFAEGAFPFSRGRLRDRTFRYRIPPEPAELLLDRPGSGRLQAVLPDGHEPASPLWREMRFVEKPQLPCSLQPVIVFGLEGLVLRLPHLIDRLSQMLGDMELVVHQFRVRRLVRRRIGVGRMHVGSHGHNLLPLVHGQRLQHRLCGSLGSLGSDVQNSGAVDVREDGDVVVASAEALLGNADVGNRRRFASLEAPFDGPIHNQLRCVPGEAEEGGGSLDDSARLKVFDGEGFEEQRETAVLSGPPRHDGLHPVILAAAPRQSDDQFRRELHRVEVPSTPLFRVIGQPAGLAAFQAGNARADVRQPDFDSPLIEPKVNSIDSPRVVNAQKTGIVRRKCVPPGNLRHGRPGNDLPMPRNSPTNLYSRDSFG